MVKPVPKFKHWDKVSLKPSAVTDPLSMWEGLIFSVHFNLDAKIFQYAVLITDPDYLELLWKAVGMQLPHGIAQAPENDLELIT